MLLKIGAGELGGMKSGPEKGGMVGLSNTTNVGFTRPSPEE
jgi:hypothetical protein